MCSLTISSQSSCSIGHFSLTGSGFLQWWAAMVWHCCLYLSTLFCHCPHCVWRLPACAKVFLSNPKRTDICISRGLLLLPKLLELLTMEAIGSASKYQKQSRPELFSLLRHIHFLHPCSEWHICCQYSLECIVDTSFQFSWTSRTQT